MTYRSPILRIAALVFALAATGCDKLGLGGDPSPTAPSGPPAAGSSIAFTAVGASEANGVGSSVPCVPFTDCPNGMSYVNIASRQLTAQGFTVTVSNLGIATAVIGRYFQTLGQQLGRTIAANFIDHEMPFVRTSTMVTVFAGVNEVNTITAALGSGAGGADPSGYIDNQVKAFAADYKTLLDGIRERAGSSRVVLLNVPNVGAMPFLANTSLAQRQAAQRISVAMTRTAVNPLASSSVFVVDLMCDPRSYQRTFYSSDGLHPNDGGYTNIAGDVVRAATSATFPAPQATCAAMSAIP